MRQAPARQRQAARHSEGGKWGRGGVVGSLGPVLDGALWERQKGLKGDATQEVMGSH